MHQVAVLLIAILAIISVAIAEPLLPNGYYRIFKGNQHVPSRNRYFTAYPDARTGSVRIEPKDEAKLQVWQLRNHSKGQVSLQIYDKNADKRKYLSEGRSGALPGASLGVTEKPQRWFITRIAGGPFTRHVLAHPRKVNNQTLVVSESNSNEEEGKINWVSFRYEGQEGYIKGWKFARVYPEEEPSE
ncbi:hypothetical protein BCR41DRAFT_352613 [Lobosporangium transversale]|uniref:Ricin B lectin domain-containing protein n=1 Tax=Lobosporangium transversale TaxID=64571 RepID=A0A1Y2GP90_9FUNG|nr:hypothetical protein BCR41DRAFT_352613 [Lobosporangium transversale]ORZ17508.1 hypothetical protein BCR41DRAFT_352613 [Lobosporangium transversale]|eukprot:XP_021881895.1 hypothetical protein BCR41DRAFT_352613 [Lobosporangium transversale]